MNSTAAGLWTRAAALYAPIVLALLAGAVQRRPPKLFAGCLLSVLWAAPALLAVQRLNQLAGWWSFSSTGFLLRDMPVELYVGWIVLWGIVPQIALARVHPGLSAAIMVAIDAFAMPLCGAVVDLRRWWLAGETVAVVLVLLPAILIARWTIEQTHLRLRALFQIATAGGVFLFLIPEIAFALRPGDGWMPLLGMVSWQRQLALQIVFLAGVPGMSAALEFAERGGGTPIPYDPPRRLVASGVYRYCANPMQVCTVTVFLLWAGLLRNGWLLLAPAMAAIYSVGIANWDESQDLEQRFGMAWVQYRAKVRNWRCRWRPYHPGSPAALYISASCGPCSELRAWIEARRPLGMEMMDAEALPRGSILRLRYDACDGSDPVDGVRAFGRALEHLNAGWAFVGAILRLPGVGHFAQLLMDASGLGPRVPFDKPTSC